MSRFEYSPRARRSSFYASTAPLTMTLSLPCGTVTAARADSHTLAVQEELGFAILATVCAGRTVYIPMNAAVCRIMAEQLLLASDYLDTQEGLK